MAELYIGNNQIGGGSSADLSNYYNKSEIDSSFGETYLVKITNASGYGAHAEGYYARASGDYSHAEG